MVKPELELFAKEVIHICKKEGITPILYGSYLLAHFLPSRKISVHDIDMYVPNDSQKKLKEILTSLGYTTNFNEDWHCLQVYKDDLLIELDSFEFYYDGPSTFVEYTLAKEQILALSREGLLHIYKKASEVSDQKEKYKEKYLLLQNN